MFGGRLKSLKFCWVFTFFSKIFNFWKSVSVARLVDLLLLKLLYIYCIMSWVEDILINTSVKDKMHCQLYKCSQGVRSTDIHETSVEEQTPNIDLNDQVLIWPEKILWSGVVLLLHKACSLRFRYINIPLWATIYHVLTTEEPKKSV